MTGRPDWVEVLAEACMREGSQAKVAKRIGYSPAVVNTVLKGTYAGDVSRVEAAVRGAFMAATVTCPVLGEIPADRCVAEQRKPFSPSNHLRVKLFRACRAGCPNSRIGRAPS